MSTGYQPRLQERLPALPENIAPLRRAVVGHAACHGASDHQRDDIALAVSEALSNVVVHAYADREPGDVAVDAWIDERSLHVVVCDDGIGMMPRVETPGLRMGLALIGQVTEQVKLESRRGSTPGLRIRMTFAIG